MFRMLSIEKELLLGAAVGDLVAWLSEAMFEVLPARRTIENERKIQQVISTDCLRLYHIKAIKIASLLSN